MPRAWISIGSNIEREANVRGAVHALYRAYGPLLLSAVYETAAVGFRGDPFYNLVAGINVQEGVAAVVARLRKIEDDHHRERSDDKFAPRTLDLDLLTYGDLVNREPGFDLPRSEILEYAFVLKPLAEVAPQDKHPVQHLTYAELWSRFRGDAANIRQVPFEFGLPADALRPASC